MSPSTVDWSSVAAADLAALARWTSEGHLDAVLEVIGDAAVARLRHPQVQARTFAPLALAVVLDRGADRLSTATVERWYDAFAAWYPAEADTRGWDDALGWLHAAPTARTPLRPSRAPCPLVARTCSSWSRAG